jgi:hypothetical protein
MYRDSGIININTERKGFEPSVNKSLHNISKGLKKQEGPIYMIEDMRFEEELFFSYTVHITYRSMN